MNGCSCFFDKTFDENFLFLQKQPREVFYIKKGVFTELLWWLLVKQTYLKSITSFHVSKCLLLFRGAFDSVTHKRSQTEAVRPATLLKLDSNTGVFRPQACNFI